MATTHDFRANERLAIVELRIAEMEKDHAATARKVDDMHELLMQAKGIRWIVLGAIGIVGIPTIFNTLMSALSHWK